MILITAIYESLYFNTSSGKFSFFNKYWISKKTLLQALEKGFIILFLLVINCVNFFVSSGIRFNDLTILAT